VSSPAAQQEGSPAALGFPDDYYERIFEVEERHWWHRGMRSLSAAMLGERLSGGAVLDSGCGTGGFLAWAMRAGEFERGSGIDVSPEAIELARRRVPDAELHVAPVAELPFADDSFDLVTLNDVLQHIPEDEVVRSLSEIRRVLLPGGALLVRTGGARRERRERPDWRAYDRRSLAREVERGGLRPLRVTYVNLVPSLAAALRGRGPHAPTHESHGIPSLPPRAVAAPAALLMSAEAALIRRTRAALPYGHTLMALAVRDDAVGVSGSARPRRARRA
jgi:SAM-dependent methyltransferase